MPEALIDRVGRALLLEPMTREDLALMLHELPKNVCRELSHLMASRHVAIRQDTLDNLKPLYYLTRKGREWAALSFSETT